MTTMTFLTIVLIAFSGAVAGLGLSSLFIAPRG